MKTMKYNMMTLDLQEILNHYHVIQDENNNYRIQYKYDFLKDRIMQNVIISNIDRYEENALLFQMEQLLCGKDNSNWNENSLLHRIVYIDFKDVFKKIHFDKEKKESYTKEELLPGIATDDTKLSYLFNPKYGIEITFDDGKDGVTKTFVPFDKSNSMARNARITFVDSEIKEKLDERLLIGFDFKKIRMIMSKYYAYRGLYLSNAHRVELDDKLKLNAETVIVIDDDEHEVTLENSAKEKINHKLFGEIGRTKDGESYYWELGEFSREKVKVEPFDGEGLVCPEYAHRINRALGEYGYIDEKLHVDKDFRYEATSYQIRMPFTKGVLHTVDYNGFIDEFVTRQEDIYIKDVFGINRDIRKAKIILTKSMFKCCGWIKAIWDVEKRSFSIDDDPMKRYFDNFGTYNHSLYVCNTDLVLSGHGKTLMSYQFFNTLDLTAEEFDSLTDEHLRQWNNRKEILQTTSDADTTDSTDDSLSGGKRKTIYAKALSINKNFSVDPKVNGMLNGIQNTVLTDCVQGRFRVNGECRFLSNDLFRLLQFIVDHLENKKENNRIVKELSGLYADRFYMPNPHITLDPSSYYAFFRNPHLSRNEQCLLRPFIAKKGTIYDRYFSHLKGVVMVSRYSLAAMTLSGADYDGDLVKIVSDKTIVDSVKKGTYKKDGNRLQRSLPIIMIPNTKDMNEEEFDKGFVTYKTIKNTFSNEVGQISNLAIKIGKKEYTEKDEKFKNKCAECTVVTGLEIDAAKTGMHPNKNIKVLKGMIPHNYGIKKNKSQKDSDYYLNAKDIILEQPRYGVKIQEGKGNDNLTLSYAKQKLGIMAYELAKDVPNLDRLPYRYAKAKLSMPTYNAPKLTDDIILFDFQKDVAWKEALDSEKINRIKALIKAYLAVFTRYRKIELYKKKFSETKFSGCVLTLLSLQYDSIDDSLPCGVTVRNALNAAYTEMDELFSQENNSADDSLKRMIEKEWQFTEKEKRPAVLRDILDLNADDYLPKEIEELLCEFYQSGYKILYYMLYHIICEKRKRMTSEILDEYAQINKRAVVKISKRNPYHEELSKIYALASDKGQTKEIWQAELVKKVHEIIGNEHLTMDEALKYVFALRNIDKSASFMWEVIPEDVILRHVYTIRKEG